MIDVNFCISYSARLKNAIESINFNEVVIDDSQLVNMLEDKTEADKHMLFMIIPDFSNSGSNGDNIKKQTDTFILILQKTDYTITHAQFLQVMQNTLISAKAVEDKMLADKYDYSPHGCQYMKRLNVGSIRITPVWGLAECNGWSVEFNFETD